MEEERDKVRNRSSFREKVKSREGERKARKMTLRVGIYRQNQEVSD